MADLPATAAQGRDDVFARGEQVHDQGTWVWNPFTDHAAGAAASYRIFRFDADESTARSLLDFPLPVHADDRSLFDLTLRTAREERTDFDLRYRVVRPDGTIRQMHAVGHPILDERGELRLFVGTAVDVTEQQLVLAAQTRRTREIALRAEISEALSEAGTVRRMLQGCAEAMVRQLDAAFARFWTVSPDGEILELQASAGLYTRLDGTHRRIRIGEHKIGLIAQERRAYLTNDVQSDSRIHDKEWAAREHMIAFAGHPLLVERSLIGVMAIFARHPLEPETLDILNAIAETVAQGIERKRSFDQLRRSQAYLTEGQRLSRTGSWALDLRTGRRFWSEETFRIFGFEPAGEPPSWDLVRRRTPTPDLVRLEAALDRAGRDGIDCAIDHRVVLVEGQVRHVRTVAHRIDDERGDASELIGTIVDMTERRRAERLLRRAMQARYRAALDERTRIARDIHDGLLQDLAGLSLQLRALLPHVVAATPDAAKKLHDIIEVAERAGREARRTVGTMRSRGDSSELVEAIEKCAWSAVAPTALELTFMISGQAQRVNAATRDASVGIVREALGNILKHAEARSIRVAIAFHSRRVRVSVQDDGKGFDASRGGTPNDNHFGLIGMRERAITVGGQLIVRSTQGSGTTVIFIGRCLPRDIA